MKSQIEYLKNNPQISQVLADGFANIFSQKPQFPISFLAQYLKSHNQLQHQKKCLKQKIHQNGQLSKSIQQAQQEKKKEREKQQGEKNHKKQKQEGFEFKIQECSNHEEFLNQYCEWIQQEKGFTGVYIGELEHQFKQIDLEKEDGEEAHIDTEAPKVIKFKAASHSHNHLMIGKKLTQESIVGKLITEKPEEGGEGGEGEQEGKKEVKPKGQTYIPLVQQNKELQFFKYPRLGSFYAVVLRVKTYLHEKVFDSSISKAKTFLDLNAEYVKGFQERQTKYKELQDERTASGADDKELQELKVNYQKEEENYPKPKQEQFEFVQRDFVVCFDTLGKDRQVSEDERAYCRRMVQFLRTSWQGKQLQLLQKDIEDQLRQNNQNIENPLSEVLVRLVDEEDKDLPSNEEVEKVKANQKLYDLEMNTLRIEKIRQYIEDQKNIVFLDTLLDRRVVKYPEIIKLFMLFTGVTKEEINFSGSNVLNWLKSQSILTKESIHKAIVEYVPRGAKPDIQVKPYAKWQRLLKCLEKYDQNTVASYNLYLAFILRFLQLVGKTRIGDNQARKINAKAQREARQQKIKEAEAKAIEKQEKLQAAKKEAEEKEQAFDEQGWNKNYDEENIPAEIGDQIVEENDEDLQDQVAEVTA